MAKRNKLTGRSYGMVREFVMPEELAGKQRSAAGASRKAQNWTLEYLKACYEAGEKQSWRVEGLEPQWRLAREDIAPWWAENHKESYKDGIQRAVNAYNNWYKTLKTTKHFGFPRFRGRGQNDSVTYTTGFSEPGEWEFQIPGFGRRRFALMEALILPAGARVVKLTVRERAGRWFVTFHINEAGWIAPDKKPVGKIETLVAIDFGVGDEFAAVSVNGQVTVVENPRFFRNGERKLRRLQQKMSRRFVRGAEEQSKNYQKARLAVARQHLRIANQRKDFVHKFTTSIVKSQDVDAVLPDQDVNVKGWTVLLGKSTHDAAVAEAIRQITYKCEWYGKTLVPVPRWTPTSKVCFECGWINPALKRGARSWTCECGAVLERNPNAARVLEEEGWKVLQSQTVDTSVTGVRASSGLGQVDEAVNTGCVSKVHIS